MGQRGVVRLYEDTIAPNRNVDKTFRLSVIALDHGRVLSGLLRREEGEQLVFSDQAGKEFSVARSEIESRTETPLSLTPEGFGETLSPAEFSDLLAYLIDRPASANEHRPRSRHGDPFARQAGYGLRDTDRSDDSRRVYNRRVVPSAPRMR